MSEAVNIKSQEVNQISKKVNALFNVLLVLYCLTCILPVWLVLSVSISSEEAILANGYRFIPEKLSFYAYEYLFKDPDKILKGYGLSLTVTIIGTLLGLLITALYAYPISRRNFPLRGFFSFFVFFTMLFNGGLVPWYMVYAKYLGLRNNILVLIIPYLIIPIYVLIMRTFFTTTIPESIFESAKIDGATEARIFVSIVLPLSKPVLATVGLFYTLMYWNDWWLSLVFITKDSMVNLQYLMYKTLKNVEFLKSSRISSAGIGTERLGNLPSEGVRMAMCIIGIGPIIFAYPFFQKYFVAGLTIGAVKG